MTDDQGKQTADLEAELGPHPDEAAIAEQQVAATPELDAGVPPVDGPPFGMTDEETHTFTDEQLEQARARLESDPPLPPPDLAATTAAMERAELEGDVADMQERAEYELSESELAERAAMLRVPDDMPPGLEHQPSVGPTAGVDLADEDTARRFRTVVDELATLAACSTSAAAYLVKQAVIAAGDPAAIAAATAAGDDAGRAGAQLGGNLVLDPDELGIMLHQNGSRALGIRAGMLELVVLITDSGWASLRDGLCGDGGCLRSGSGLVVASSVPANLRGAGAG